MSWSQIRKRFEEMEAYLGKDKEGIRRLKLLKDEVNVLRTDLATAKEETQLANTIKDAARERADAAEIVMKEMQVYAKSNEIKIHSMSQRVEALSKTIGELTRTAEDKEVEEPGVIVIPEEAEVKAVIKTLRRKLRYCPKAMSHTFVNKAGVRPDVFNRDDIATGWSHESLWVLGASMALISLFLGQVSICTDTKVCDMKHKGDDSGMLRNIFQWYAKNNMAKPDPVEGKMYDELSFSYQGSQTAAGYIERH